ncbi:MAG: hypothetical protein JSS04_14485 [Proteobacteria bacterium]|nr:hypothetical protein [Pseudomonadota bacterium]
MGPSTTQLHVLGKAISCLQEENVQDYHWLFATLRERPVGFEARFRQEFAKYYQLNRAHLGDVFKEAYFDRLFRLKLVPDSDPYTEPMEKLYSIPRLKGDCALQASFVSKLVAIHDETRPVWDIHVRDFFGIKDPKARSVTDRIAGYVAILEELRRTYACWARNSEFLSVVAQVRARFPLLGETAPQRIADLLIWSFGRSAKRGA